MLPTDQVSLADIAASAVNPFRFASVGVVATLHVLPSQRSTRDWALPPTSRVPTTHTLLAETAATSDIPITGETVTLGSGTTLHAPPFQCRRSAWSPVRVS